MPVPTVPGSCSPGHPVRSRRQALRALTMLSMAAAGAHPLRLAHAAAPLRIGLTPVFLDDQVGFLERWRAYLEAQLDRPVRFVQRGSYSEVLRLLLDGQTEFAWLCGFPYWRNRDRLQLVAVPVYRGAPLYRSYLIRNQAHGDIRSLQDLQGLTFAYSDPDSNSGFLYVQHRLKQAGHLNAQFFGRSFFTWAHRKVVEAVSVQLAHAGAVDGYVWDVLDRIAPELTATTVVFEQSQPFGFPPIVAMAWQSSDMVRSMRAVLEGMRHDPEGHALLAILALDGFETGSPSLFDGIGRMADTL
ncbi:MAG: PhnD/SsuA/transferrin family substrate-binding protein [Rhodocyclaceae bacterium]